MRQEKPGTTKHSHGQSKNAAINSKEAPNTNKPFITVLRVHLYSGERGLNWAQTQFHSCSKREGDDNKSTACFRNGTDVSEDTRKGNPCKPRVSSHRRYRKKTLWSAAQPLSGEKSICSSCGQPFIYRPWAD